ncbi:uncharacterized protein METZ01_LOCUS320615 [marine metagenome]|uniref:Uncharacterized protein n=1 Tax=marine metagenome TaxID=408172 RepID=A0A382P7E0_9ZZZZ
MDMILVDNCSAVVRTFNICPFSIAPWA